MRAETARQKRVAEAKTGSRTGTWREGERSKNLAEIQSPRLDSVLRRFATADLYNLVSRSARPFVRQSGGSMACRTFS